MSIIVNQHEFWMVWNPRGHAPTHQHSTEGSAVAEASRLAQLHRGHRFYVLRATDYVTVNDVSHVRLLPSDETPF